MAIPLVTLLLALLLVPWTNADVVTLNDATFLDKVKEKDTLWFIKFCVPWCKHCARANLIWEELGQAVDMEDGVEIAEVDCTMSKTTCGKFKIRSYPTLKLFYDGEDYKKYTGHHNVTDLKKFALEAAVELTRVDDEDQ